MLRFYAVHVIWEGPGGAPRESVVVFGALRKAPTGCLCSEHFCFVALCIIADVRLLCELSENEVGKLVYIYTGGVSCFRGRTKNKMPNSSSVRGATCVCRVYLSFLPNFVHVVDVFIYMCTSYIRSIYIWIFWGEEPGSEGGGAEFRKAC